MCIVRPEDLMFIHHKEGMTFRLAKNGSILPKSKKENKKKNKMEKPEDRDRHRDPK